MPKPYTKTRKCYKDFYLTGVLKSNFHFLSELSFLLFIGILSSFEVGHQKNQRISKLCSNSPLTMHTVYIYSMYMYCIVCICTVYCLAIPIE